MKAIGKVVDTLGLRGVSYEAALLSSNKWEMKQAFMEYGVRTAKFSKVTSIDEAYAAMDSLFYLSSLKLLIVVQVKELLR